MKKRENTERKILEAFEQILIDEGFQQLKIRHIAGVAKVDKVLIYRYFGGLEGLARTYAESAEFWPDIDESLNNVNEDNFRSCPEDAIRILIKQHISAIRNRRATAAILTWELVESSPVCQIFSEIREKHAMQIFEFLSETKLFDREFLNGFGAIFGATLNYLCIRSQNQSLFSGIDIQAEEGWKQLEDAFVAIAMSQVKALDNLSF